MKKSPVRTCPQCGSTACVPILYGLPGDREIIAQAERGEIVLGGCCVTGHDPQWQCSACRHQFRSPSRHRRSNGPNPE